MPEGYYVLKGAQAFSLLVHAEYRRAQQEMKELQIAKHNVEQLLKKEEQEHQDRQKKKDNPLL